MFDKMSNRTTNETISMVEGELTSGRFRGNKICRRKVNLKGCETRFVLVTGAPLDVSRDKNVQRRKKSFFTKVIRPRTKSLSSCEENLTEVL